MAPGQQQADSVEPHQTIWRPQSGPQTRLITCPASIFEVFFGGARGGGKTDGMLGEWVAHANRYGGDAIGLMIRRSLTQLIETIERSHVLYSPIGARYNTSEKMWTFPNGARLRFAYLERDQDADGYQGHSYSRIYVEEIGTFPNERPILKLMATLRSGAGVPVGFRSTGNPGGPGHHWVKQRYIDPAPTGNKIITDEVTGLKRIFIPSRVTDNKYLGEQYVQQIKASGSPQLVRAWLEGDWNVIEGAFFTEWTSDVIVEPFEIPRGWFKFRSMDWGYATPFSVNWWAVIGDDFQHPVNRRVLPRGALVCYREWYGSSAPNVGLRLTAEDVAVGIKNREAGDGVRSGALDPSAFAQTSGPSIAERLAVAGIWMKPADNKRVGGLGTLGGWDQMRSRLRHDRLFFFSTCVAAIRTIPLLQHDQDRPEDLDTSAEDHAADSVRYACMSRPWIASAPKPKVEDPMRGIGQVTVNEYLRMCKPPRLRV